MYESWFSRFCLQLEFVDMVTMDRGVSHPMDIPLYLSYKKARIVCGSLAFHFRRDNKVEVRFEKDKYIQS
jgi:hypothetical protein